MPSVPPQERVREAHLQSPALLVPVGHCAGAAAGVQVGGWEEVAAGGVGGWEEARPARPASAE